MNTYFIGEQWDYLSFKISSTGEDSVFKLRIYINSCYETKKNEFISYKATLNFKTAALYNFNFLIQINL